MINLRKLARGQDCQIRIPGVCNFNPETTVLCHLPSRAMGMKSHDLHGAWGCSSCHDEIDNRSNRNWVERDTARLYHLEGVIRTQEKLLKMGAISIAEKL